MTEPEVVQRVHQFLKAGSHAPSSTHLLYTDAHPTLTDIRQLKPFQRVSLNLGGYTGLFTDIGSVRSSFKLKMTWLPAHSFKGSPAHPSTYLKIYLTLVLVVAT